MWQRAQQFPRLTLELGFPLTLIARSLTTYTCTEHHDVQPWHVVDFHWPDSFGFDLLVCAKAFKLGFKAELIATAVAVATAVFKKSLRVIIFLLSFILKSLLFLIS
jgi:hypothetical protein